jgi:hypothetical protein
VKGRDEILIHAFNNALNDSQGCIAPVTTILAEGQGTRSRDALKRLMLLLKPAFDRNKPVFLTIKKKKDEVNTRKSKRADAKVL